MRASLSYHYQKLTSALMVISLIVLSVVDFIFSANSFDWDFAFFVPVSIVSFIVFIFAFGIYSYLRGNVLFLDYVKSRNLANFFSSIILFINIFTCVSALVAIIYIHFSVFISLS